MASRSTSGTRRPRRGAGSGRRGGGIRMGINNVTGTAFAPRLPRQNPARTYADPGRATGAVRIELSGPWFDTRSTVAMKDLIHDLVETVANQGLAEWHLNLDRSLQYPTPYYETQILSQRVADDAYIVHDRGIVYGPWLEGVGERNKSTRFKGYFAQRRAVHTLKLKIQMLADPIITRHVRRMNG